MRHPLTLPFALIVTVAACSGGDDTKPTTDPAGVQRADSIARARQDSVNRASPGYIVDSILSVEEEIRRFRAAIGGAAVTGLAEASASRESLVQRLVAAVTANDTAALQRTVVTAREFIDLVYPESPYTKPPYRQAPGLVWTLITEPSNSGRRRLLAKLGGKPLTISALTCPGAPDLQGRNRLWQSCTVRYTSDADSARTGRLFGSILERDGRFKFMSLANQY
ncbi:MAG: hypothetical protein Q8K55_01285 [Gemmatimonadaceae bacterium]|nr:hypothetical protein [Gemmatimonadaceae bacterium]